MANIARAFRERFPGAQVVKRARNAIHVETSPGRFVAEIHMGPIHRLDGGEIDTAWVADSGTWQHKMDQADYKAQAKAAFNGAPLVRYEHVASGQWVTLQPRQLDYSNDRNDVQMISAVQGVTATVDDDVLLWTGAYGAGRDFKWQASTDRLAKELILQTAAAAPTPSAQVLGGANPILRLAYTFAFSAGVTPFVDGVEWNPNSTATTAGAIEFRAANGDVLWRFAVPQVRDTGGNVAPGVVQRLSRSGPNLLCEVRVPWSWLQSAAYPVSIDPTLELQPDGTAGLDTQIVASVPTSNYGTNASFGIGHSTASGTTYRALVKFDLSTVPDTFDSAVFSIVPHDDQSANARTYGVYRTKRDWVEIQATWNIWKTSNNWSTAGGFHADDCEQVAVASRAFTATETLNVFKDFPFTGITTKAALDLGNGWMIKVDTENNDQYFFRSSEYTTAAQRPKLTVEYTEAAAPDAPSNLSVVQIS